MIEDLLFALICVISSFGFTHVQGGTQQSSFSALQEAAEVLVAASKKHIPQNDAALAGVIGAAIDHFSENIKQILRICGGGSQSNKDGLLKGAEIPSLIWLSIVRISLSAFDSQDVGRILGSKLLTVCSSLCVFNSEWTKVDTTGFFKDTIIFLLIVVAGTISDSKHIAGHTQFIRYAFKVGCDRFNAGLFAKEALDWYNKVSGKKEETVLTVMLHWLKAFQKGNRPPIECEDLVLLLDCAMREDGALQATIISFALDFISGCILDIGCPVSHVSNALVSIFTLCADSNSWGVSTNEIIPLLKRSHDSVFRFLFTPFRIQTSSTAPLQVGFDVDVLLRSSALAIDVCSTTLPADIVAQTITPREASALTLSAAAPCPNSFYLMFVDHTALDVLSHTNSTLPQNSITMSTEVNAFASLMTRYTTAGGVMLCVTPATLLTCSPLSTKMLGQWWKMRVPWLGVVPLGCFGAPVVSAGGITRCAFEKAASFELSVAQQCDIGWALSFAVTSKRGGCQKTAIVTAKPELYTDVFKECVEENNRPTTINIFDLLSKLVKK